MEGFLASSPDTAMAGAVAGADEGEKEEKGAAALQGEDGGPEELLRLLTSDEVRATFPSGCCTLLGAALVYFIHPRHLTATRAHGRTNHHRQGACYLIEDSTSGTHTVRCNARMADMFISTEELQGLVDQTGLAVGHLMMR